MILQSFSQEEHFLFVLFCFSYHIFHRVRLRHVVITCFDIRPSFLFLLNYHGSRISRSSWRSQWTVVVVTYRKACRDALMTAIWLHKNFFQYAKADACIRLQDLIWTAMGLLSEWFLTGVIHICMPNLPYCRYPYRDGPSQTTERYERGYVPSYYGQDVPRFVSSSPQLSDMGYEEETSKLNSTLLSASRF